MDYHSITDIGKERKINEDSFANYFSSKFALFLVADGLGGHKAGEVASKMAVQEIQNYVIEHKTDPDYATVLLDAINNANHKIFSYQTTCEDCSSMGTTIVACLLSGENAWIAHVGDSRAYLQRDGELKQITKDHSLVQNLVDRGILSADDAKTYPDKNAVTRALGIDDDVKVDIDYYPLVEGDILLIATDGLTNMVDDDAISSVLQRSISTREKVDTLLHLALTNGGYDNITISAFQYRSTK